MKNVEMKLEGKNTLVIRIDLTQTFGPSTSGKTTIVASTGGNVAIPGTPALDGLHIGLNVYKKGAK